MYERKMVALLALGILMPIYANAQNTVHFNTSDVGQTKAITEWGIEVAWVSADNIRYSKGHIGESEIDVIFSNFYTDEALVGGDIGPNSKAAIDIQVAVASILPNAAWGLGPTVDNTDPYYLNGSEVWPDRWAALMEATKNYYTNTHGKTIAHVMPFNEPDYWAGQGTPQNLNDILVLLAGNSSFNGVGLMGPSTLNSDWAQWWYDQIAGPVTHGTTHQLAGSTDSYVNFIQHVIANGDIAYNPELHSMAEAIYGCEYGLSGGAWWGPVLRPRGLFVRSCQGDRLGYAENRSNYSAAAVYRAPDGQLYGFASCFERQGALTPYRFVCTDRDVYFNGIGPIREFMLTVTTNYDLYVNIDYDTGIFPALDGNRWKIVNRQTGKVMEVQGGGLGDGVNIRGATDTGVLYQRWDIVSRPEKNLQQDGYYRLFNANSGRTAEVAYWSLDNGGNIWQYGEGDNDLQAWFIENANNGYFYIRNEFSLKYMTDGGSNIYQWDLTGNNNQQWQFILANPAVSGTLTAHYEFEGNVNDSAGSNDGTVTGSPIYTSGQIGQAIDLDGIDDYVTLPSGIVNTDDITIAAWINWDGGSSWQRIFDFGNDTTSYMFLTPSSGDNTLRFAITTDSNGSEQILDTDPLPIGEWVHLAVTISGNTSIMYIDGEARVAGQIRLNPSDVNPVNNYIGQSQWPDPLFNGRIDDFRIYNYALSDTEIVALYNWAQPAALISHWPLDESEGLIAPDMAGDNDGILINGPIWEPNDGAIDGALAFDGEDDYVDLATYTDLGWASAFTICFWVNPAQLPFDGHEGIIGIGTGSQRAPWIWGNYNSYNLRMQFETTTGGISDGDLQIGEIAEDTWTHVVVTWDGSTCYSYINGSFDNADDTIGDTLVVSDGVNYLGYIAGYGYWPGLLDDVRIYNYALSPAEIGGLYLQGRPSDLDEDGDVDFVDLYTFAGQYLQPPAQPADFNDDGKVNLADYAEMAIDWLVGVE